MTSREASLLLVLALGAACHRQKPSAPPAAPPAKLVQPPAPAPKPAAAAPSVTEEELVEEPPEANPTSETVTIKLVAEPSRKARVFWGRKDLGLAPLELQRPRNSGPLDLLVVAPGALPLHTRVFTDRDDKLALRLVAETDGPGMLGYRPEAVPPEKPARPDAARSSRPSAQR